MTLGNPPTTLCTAEMAADCDRLIGALREDADVRWSSSAAPLMTSYARVDLKLVPQPRSGASRNNSAPVGKQGDAVLAQRRRRPVIRAAQARRGTAARLSETQGDAALARSGAGVGLFGLGQRSVTMKAFERFSIAVVVAAAFLSGGAVLAHHGVTGRYDTGSPIVLAGTVTRATFSPPHPVLSLRAEAVDVPTGDLGRPDEFTGPFVARPDDVGQLREIEFSPVRAFYALRDRLRVGDRVTVIALRNCLPPHQLRSSWIQLPDGEVVSRAGGLHRRVNGCR